MIESDELEARLSRVESELGINEVTVPDEIEEVLTAGSQITEVDDEGVPVYRTEYNRSIRVMTDSEASDIRDEGYRTFNSDGGEIIGEGVDGDVAYVVPEDADLSDVDHLVGEDEDDDTIYAKVTDKQGDSVYLDVESLTIEKSPLTPHHFTGYADDYGGEERPWPSGRDEPGEYGWHFSTLEIDAEQ